MKKLYIKIDEQGYWIDDVHIGGDAPLKEIPMLSNPDNENEITDSEGIVVKEAIILEPILDPSYIDPVEFPLPQGLYTPRFVDGVWVEGKSQAEIDEILSLQEPIPDPNLTIEERITQLELLALTDGGLI